MFCYGSTGQCRKFLLGTAKLAMLIPKRFKGLYHSPMASKSWLIAKVQAGHYNVGNG